MPEKTAYEIWQDMPKYQLPHERRRLRREWWTAAQAARAWGVSPKTARRYFERLGEATLIMTIDVRTDRRRVLECVRAGTLRPPVRRGNPNFRNPDWQSANAARRWEGHITAAEREMWRQEQEAAAFEEAVEFAGEMLGDQTTDEEWEPPEFNPDPDPPPPFFQSRWEREAYERKQARLARGCTH